MRRKLGVTQIPEFWKMKALLPILLELDKSVNYNYHEKMAVFDICEPITVPLEVS